MAFTEYLQGKRERMSWVAETAWATGGTMTGGEIVGLDCTITAPDWKQGYQENLTAGADDLYVQGRIKGPKSLPYILTFNPVNWRWLKYLFSVADADDGGIKTHTFTQNTAYTSWKMEWARRATTSNVHTMIGNFCKRAMISFSKSSGAGTDGKLMVAMNCVAQDESEGSSVTTISAGNITKTPFLYRNIKLTIASAEYKELNNGEMTIDLGTNENDSRYCNSTYDNLLGEPIPGITRVTGRFNITIKDKTLYDLWATGAAITGTNTLLVDRDGTGDDQLLATFNNFYILSIIGPTNFEGPTNVDLVWVADKFISLVARDDISTY